MDFWILFCGTGPKKTKIGPDSIINYFIFIQIQKLPEGSKTSNKHLNNFFGTGSRRITFLGLVPFSERPVPFFEGPVPFLRDQSPFLRDRSLFLRDQSLFPRERSLFLRDWFFFWGTGPASFGPVHWKQVHLHIVNSMCSSLVYLVNTLWVPS